MVTIGAATTELVAKNATLTINSILHAAAKMWTIGGGFTVHEEPVCGTDIQRLIHGVFKAKFKTETLYVSDDTLKALGWASTRDQMITVVSVDKDTGAIQGTVTTTFTMKVSNFERAGPSNADGVVRSILEGILAAVPT